MCLILWSYSHSCADAFIGINWGRLSSQRLIPSMVVDLLLQNDITNVRIFQQSANVLEAFSDSGIRVTVGLSNSLLDRYMNESTLQWWIEDKILKYEKVMRFGYVTIGSNPFTIYPNSKLYFNVVDVAKNMQKQLYNNSISYLKTTTPHYTDVLNLTSSSKPSEVDFRDDIKAKMIEYVRFLRDNDSPFLLTVYPIDFVNTYDLDLEFAFMDKKSTHIVQDINATYTNAFELLYDSLHWALTKAGAGMVKIEIGAIGWPTDSYRGASVENAERFYRTFLPYIASGRGTPMRPNQNIDVFLNTLSDENRMPVELGLFQRHWGIYKFNGEPKYKIDLSGKGRDILPSTAKGVIQMPNRWCVFNKNNDDPMLVETMKNMACNVSDCSSLEKGGSCSTLSYEDKVSYAFNRYFQTMGQASESSNEKCDLGGLGKVLADNPSKGGCDFPVEILSAEYVVEGETFGSAGERLYGRISSSMGLLVLLLLRMII
ncbi:glucan endo-1,3-beta-glucosidase 8-like [Dorcoceras hygrometricum]|uniref:Glucan endo-1,3-beta-glucosidase 8-like n=1 Tax=Dorcoceras hygrometricum TaxID=472368 RepID=A0A2Z7AC61_9LAMI|nr:glucan endo-1,3-beta-glucosidase 8-like [Dorcoceras hygrometricum]